MQSRAARAPSPRPCAARATATDRISASSATQPRHDEAGERASGDARGARSRVRSSSRPLDLLLAPAALERGGVQRGDRGGVARARASDSAGSPRPNRLASKLDHRRGSCAGVLRLRVGRAQIKRLRRRAGRPARRRRAAPPSRCRARARCSTARGGGSPRRPGARPAVARRCRRAAARRSRPRAHRLAQRRDAAAPPACGRRRRTLADRRARAAHRSPPPPAALSSAAISGAAKAASVDRPTAGLPAASAMPRAAAMPTRRPVKLPGPAVTAMRSRSAKSQRRRAPSRARSAASALRRGRAPSACDSCAAIAPRSVSSTAAEQASSAVSMARTRMQIRRHRPRRRTIQYRERSIISQTPGYWMPAHSPGMRTA